MKLEINCTPKEFEMANFLLKQGYESAIVNKKFQIGFSVDKKQLKQAEEFRLKMLKAFKILHS